MYVIIVGDILFHVDSTVLLLIVIRVSHFAETTVFQLRMVLIISTNKKIVVKKLLLNEFILLCEKRFVSSNNTSFELSNGDKFDWRIGRDGLEI